ncbi:hypothetical protein Tco_1433012, partial [Tanacetum coccineum]
MSLLVIERFNLVGALSMLSDRIGSAMTSCSSFFNQLAMISSSCNKDDRYAVLDRELDTPYLMEVDTLYLAIDQNS